MGDEKIGVFKVEAYFGDVIVQFLSGGRQIDSVIHHQRPVFAFDHIYIDVFKGISRKWAV